MSNEESFSAKKRLTAVAIASAVVFLIGTLCAFFTRVKVEAGQEAVLVEKPLFIGHGGVNKTPVQSGAVWVWRTTMPVVIDIRPVQYKEAFDDIMTADNVPVDFNAFAKIQVKAGNTPLLLEKFGTTWYQNNLQQIIRTEVRDAVAKHAMTALTTRSDILNDVQKSIFKEVKDFAEKAGLPVILNEIIIEKITPPPAIVETLANTAAQQQRAKTEIERAKAEDQRKDAETKRAVADNAYRNALGLSPEQFVHLEAIKANREAAFACKDSKGGCTVIVGQIPHGGTIPLK